MGLDIYFHHFKSESNDIKTITEENDKKAQERLTSEFDKVILELRTINRSGSINEIDQYSSVEYFLAYAKFVEKVKKMYNYDFSVRQLTAKIPTIAELLEIKEKMVEGYYAQYDAYFRKANFVYAFFQPYLDDEWCFVTVDMLRELIEKCDQVLRDKSQASKILPTQSGFFFGSTDYDDWYFSDVKSCKKQMTKLLKAMEKDNELRCYVDMSW